MSRLCIVAALPFIATAAHAAPAPVLTHIRPLTLHDGVNPVPTMAEGRAGMIIQAQREYFTADGAHKTFMVMLRAPKPEQGWSLVPHQTQEVFNDAPHTGEDSVRAVRFARAQMSGASGFFALVAERAFEGSIPAASHTTISLYRLQVSKDDGPSFALIGERTTTACYGDADLALKVEMGLPLPADYAGPKAAGPCGQD